MIIKIAVLILFFYVLTILQTSFLPHFDAFGGIPNLILISVIVINFFTQNNFLLGLASALIGGLFLDVFSSNPIGWNIAGLTGLAIFMNFILKKYVRFSISKRI